MDEPDLAPLFRRLTGALKPTESTTLAALAQAGRAIALAMRSGHKDPPATAASRELLTKAELERVMAALPEEQEWGAIRVFRRESPILSDLATESVPAWAAGQEVEQTFGPFLDEHGRRVWIDVWRIVAQTPIVNALTEKMIGTVPASLLTAAGLVIELPPGSIWWEAASFDAASPKGSYFGTRIRSGLLRFSSLPVSAGGALRVSPGTSITLDLTLDPPGLTPTATGRRRW